MLSLNILIYNKIIKQTAEPGVSMLQFEVNYVLLRIKQNS